MIWLKHYGYLTSPMLLHTFKTQFSSFLRRLIILHLKFLKPEKLFKLSKTFKAFVIILNFDSHDNNLLPGSLSQTR